MRRRRLIGILGVTVGLSGCLRWRDKPEAFVDAISLKNVTGEPVDLDFSISQAGSDVYTETVSLSGSGRHIYRIISEPVSEPGKYIIRVEYDGIALEINTIEEITPDKTHMAAVIYLKNPGYFDTDILTDDEKMDFS